MFVVGVAFALLAALAQPAHAFGPLANGAIADYLPDGWRQLAQAHRPAFDAGANFPDYASTDDVPDWLKRVYQGFRPQDRFRRPGVDTRALPLLLELMQSATTADEAAFALGALCNITGDMVLRQFYVPMRMCEYGGPLTRSDTARTVVEMLVELYLASESPARQRMMSSLRRRDIGLFQLWFRVAAKAGERLSIEDFMSDVGLHELGLEMKINATGPGGTLATAVNSLSFVVPAASGLYEQANYRDVIAYLRIAGAAAASLAADGYQSPWVTNGWGRDGNPYPLLAGSMHDPLRTAQEQSMPDWMLTPNPGVLIVDSYMLDPDGNRCDIAPPTACEPANRNADDPPRRFTAVLRLAAARPLDTQIALAVKRDIENAPDPEIATMMSRLQFTAADVASGVVRDYRLPFSFASSDGPFREGPQGEPFTLGFYLVARVPLRISVDRNVALTFFTTYTPPQQELVGFHTYNRWPFSLRVAEGVTACRGTVRRGRINSGESNEAPPARFAESRPRGFEYHCPYALVSDEASEVRVPAPGQRELIGTLQLALGGTRAVVLLHEHGGGRADWSTMQQRLLAAGVSSLAIDFRGRGLSGSMTDRAAWSSRDDRLIAALPDDARAAIAYLSRRANVPPSRIVLAGAGLGASVALCAAAADAAAVPGVIALSPEADCKPLDMAAAMTGLRDRPVLLVCAAEDRDDVAAVAALRKLHPDAAAKVTTIATPLDRLHGKGARGLQRHEPLPGRVIDWLVRATAD
ncbi:MAG: alpha/beta hydrolase [Planctomycetota bacterium]